MRGWGEINFMKEIGLPWSFVVSLWLFLKYVVLILVRVGWWVATGRAEDEKMEKSGYSWIDVCNLNVMKTFPELWQCTYLYAIHFFLVRCNGTHMDDGPFTMYLVNPSVQVHGICFMFAVRRGFLKNNYLGHCA